MIRMKILSLLALCLSFGLAGPEAEASERVYRFSPVNQWDITRTASYWNPIIRYVETKSGVRLELKIGRTSADTTSYVLAEEVEFVFSNHLFSPEREALGWKVFGRRNAPPLRGQIAVPADSPVRTLDDLQGKTLVYAGPSLATRSRLPNSSTVASRSTPPLVATRTLPLPRCLPARPMPPAATPC